MNTENSSQCQCGIFLPTLLIAASLLVFFIWQLTTVSAQRTVLDTSRQQLEESFKNSTPQHEQLIKQSQAVQAKLEKIANGLLDLAKDGDSDAKAIVAKYNISKQTPTPAAAPSPAK